MARTSSLAKANRQLLSGSIVSKLKRDITRGRTKPGSRLPTRDELVERFSVSRATVQKALDELIRDGFVHAEGRRGTFVSDNPPHLSTCALVFAKTPQDDFEWSRFYAAIANESRVMERADGIRFKHYYDLQAGPDSPDGRRLQDDAAADRLAGIIYTYPPYGLQDTPLVKKGILPQIAIMDEAAIEGVLAVYPDQHSFLDRALEHLAGRGRKRLAVVTVPEYREDLRRHLAEAARKLGMETADEWTHSVCLCTSARPWVRNIVHLMMSSAAPRRPDALIVADDNFVEYASAGLIAAGVRVGEDVDVVAHCNFPWPPPSVLPLKRLGFDVRRLVRTCVEIVDRIRRREKTPGSTRVPALFEDEVVVHTNEARGGY